MALELGSQLELILSKLRDKPQHNWEKVNEIEN